MTASLEFAIFEFLAAYLTSALLWSSERVWSTARWVSEESHSDFALQLQSILSTGRNTTSPVLRRITPGSNAFGVRDTPYAMPPLILPRMADAGQAGSR